MTTKTHGESRRGQWTKRYKAWVNMMRRCRDPNFNEWTQYGGRGVQVSLRWHSYVNFATDMEPHPGTNWTLDRIDTNADYGPGNCRWATMQDQNRNRRNNKLTARQAKEIKVRRLAGESGPALASQFGVSKQMIYHIAAGREWV